MMRALLFIALLAAPAAFNIGGKPSPRATTPKPSPPPKAAYSAGQDLWERYVLIRPAEKEVGEGWWAQRTPGTGRTIFFSSIFCGLVALPYLLTNTVVLTWLIELAALDRVGVTPSEVSPLDLVRINEESAIRSIVR